MLAYLFVILAIAVRFMPHPFAFTPVGASLLFFGARGPRRQWWITLLLLAASDVILTKLVYVFPFTWDHFVTWAWYGAMLWLGTRLRETNKPLPILGASLAGSISFFVISNFAVWGAWGDMYPRTVTGLMACYAAGVPFFRRALEGDILFTCAMFLTPVVLQAISRATNKSGDHIAAA
jgi:uncharacterized protein DUF6580